MIDMFQIKKKILNVSKGLLCPSPTAQCQLTVCCSDSFVSGEYFSTGFDTQNVFSLAEPAAYYDSVLSECIVGMKEGELSHFTVSFTAVDSNKPESLDLTVRLHSFTQSKEACHLSSEEKVGFAAKWKSTGNSFFSKDEICMAGYWYSRALFVLISCCTDDFEIPFKEKYEDLLCNCRLNLSVVQLRRKLHDHVIQNCTKAYAVNPRSVKALYRRAQAYAAKGDRSSALKDLKLALMEEPRSGAIRKMVKEITLEMSSNAL